MVFAVEDVILGRVGFQLEVYCVHRKTNVATCVAVCILENADMLITWET